MTETTTTALLPCPMCDTPASFGRVTYDPRTVREQGWPQDTFHYVNCPACGVKNHGVVGFKTQKEAAAAWNRRAAPSSPSAAQPDPASVDAIVSALYRRFKGWAARGFGPDDVTWCEVRADVLALIATAAPGAQPAQPDAEERGVSDVRATLQWLLDQWEGDGWVTEQEAMAARVRAALGTLSAARASAPEVVEKGVWVPLEPTDEMMSSGETAYGNEYIAYEGALPADVVCHSVYRAMIAAALRSAGEGK